MYLIVLLAVLALTGVFAVQNGGTQDFHYLGYGRELPVWAPTAIGVGIVSVLLIVVRSYTGLGSRLREIGHGRELDQHVRVIEDLRTENARLREELAEARGALSVVPAAGRDQAGGAVPEKK
jgi:hypothetical protein